MNEPVSQFYEIHPQVMNEINGILQRLPFKFEEAFGTGSHFICGTQDTDIDVVIRPKVGSYVELFTKLCDKSGEPDYYDTKHQEGYECTADDSFLSVRVGRFNLIFVIDDAHFERWVRATQIAMMFPDRFTTKEDRVKLFAAIRKEDSDAVHWFNGYAAI